MKHAFPKRCLLACALALAAALAGCASTSPAEQQIQLEQCQQTTFKATLHPGYVVPPTNSAARGELVAEFNRFTGLLSFCVQFEGLSGPVLAANFHSPAMEGEEAAPTLSIGRMFVSPYEGRAAYLARAEREPARIVVLDAARTPADIDAEIATLLQQRFPTWLKT